MSVKKKKGGGVGFLIANEIHFTHRPVFDLMEENIEHCGIEIATKGRNIMCTSVYRPPNTNVKIFNQMISLLMEKIKSDSRMDVVYGMDHNLDFLKSTLHRDTNTFINCILDNALLPCITRPTRITNQSSTLIDNILLNCRLHARQRSCIIIHDLSDHFPSLTILENTKTNKKTIKKTSIRQITDWKIEGLKKDLKKLVTTTNYERNDVNESYRNFSNSLQSCMDEHIPLKEITIPAKQFVCESWLIKGLIKCGRKQLSLYESSLKSGNKDDLERYKHYRSQLQKIKRRAKIDYYNNQCVKFKNDTKRLWHTINNIIKSSSRKTDVIDKIRVNNLVLTDAKEITNAFGQYFSAIGRQVAMKGGNSTKNISEYINKIPRLNKCMFLTPCSKEEISSLIDKLPNKHSSGHDNVDNILLKKLSSMLIEPLCFIFNLSLANGVFPDDMKLADAVPLFKGGNNVLLMNYRPISLLPTISKLLEKIMYNRTYEFLDLNNIFFNSQYGFRKKHLCEHAITELTSEICKGLENGKHTMAIFIDLSKAFDTISHHILYQKLERYGIRGVALDWYKSYLSNRKLRAKCKTASSENYTYSDQYNLDIGTPQGSCLGPLIFLIFCNDLYLNLEMCNGILFVDDTTIYKSHSNLNFLRWSITNDLEILIDWFKANHLSLNDNKTVGMLFGKNPSSVNKLPVGKLGIRFVDTTKFLGVHLDNKMSWKYHLDKLICKIKRNINLLKCGNKFLTVHTKRLIYFAHIQSHISYGLSIWGNMISSSNLNKLQKLQNKCVILINGSTATDTNLKSLCIMKINDLLRLENYRFGYKFLQRLLPIKIIDLIKCDQTDNSLIQDHVYNTRHKNLLNKPQAKNKFYKSCLIIKGMDALTSLKAETIQKPSLQSFTQSCKKEIFDLY